LFPFSLEYGSKKIAIQLIDFGVAIDMNMFEKNTTFKYTTSKPDTFTCIEMREAKPWTYQTDLFGVAGSAHVMLFGKYMEVEKKMVNWQIKSKLPRYFNKLVWDNFFNTLLNVRDCREMPNLQTVRYSLDEAIAQKEKYVKEKVVEFNKCLL
jgi:checkpoint serine/threonine-protein kinase